MESLNCHWGARKNFFLLKLKESKSEKDFIWVLFALTSPQV